MALFRGTGLLDESLSLNVERRGGRHSCRVEAERVARGLGGLAVVSLGAGGVVRRRVGAAGVCGFGLVAGRCRRCDFHEVFHGAPVCAGAAAASGWSAGFVVDQRAVDVTKPSRLHALATFGTAAWDNRAVDCVWNLIEPLVSAFAAV